jgi:D-serine deaminase-like pyridoxal phosphate-dependent protein
MGDDWHRYRRALGDEPLPAALVDLDALEANAASLSRAANGKPLRVATKSIRSVELLRRIGARSLMTYSAAETAWLAAQGFGDLLLGYPTLHPRDCRLLAEANRSASAVALADAPEQLAALSAAAREAGARVPVAIEVDMAYRPLGLAHLGVRRSPLRKEQEVVALARAVATDAHLEFRGLLAYEAQIAGLPDSAAARALKRLSLPDVARRRASLARALAQAGLPARLFNGAGTGSLHLCSGEAALTEVTAGSGFLASHLFDHLPLRPAAFFALQVVRRPARGMVTCHGGGLIASGGAGPDRLPQPALPKGARLLPREGAGEVQTPLRLPSGVSLQLGDPVFFRHAKAGELAEHFNEYLLVRGDRIEGRAKTYRGEGHAFLG